MADYQLKHSGLLCYSASSPCTLAGPVVVASLKGTDSCLGRLHLQRTEELATLDVRFTTKRPSAGTLVQKCIVCAEGGLGGRRRPKELEQ